MTAYLDTSVLVRYFMRDVEDLARIALRIVEQDQPLLVTPVVLAETAHVLLRNYGLPRAIVVESLRELVENPNISVPGIDKGWLHEALALCQPSGRVSIPDALTWAQARSSGTRRVYSFDARFPSDGLEIRTKP
ncbi:MAG: PIN domain-containing protein [Chloroflexi bacterium]|nr:PIN domain-containing protein [Chloroflexota bacterium]